jgi:lactoylglutathione lyase
MPRAYRLDHASLLVRNLGDSVRFYTEVFGFQPIPIEPGHPQILWLSIGDLDALHLTEGDVEGVHLEKAIHFALRVEDLDSFIVDLQARSISFCDWPGHEGQVGRAPGGYRQIFIQDPDGYWVEINDHGPAGGGAHAQSS